MAAHGTRWARRGCASSAWSARVAVVVVQQRKNCALQTKPKAAIQAGLPAAHQVPVGPHRPAWPGLSWRNYARQYTRSVCFELTLVDLDHGWTTVQLKGSTLQGCAAARPEASEAEASSTAQVRTAIVTLQTAQATIAVRRLVLERLRDAPVEMW